MNFKFFVSHSILQYHLANDKKIVVCESDDATLKCALSVWDNND